MAKPASTIVVSLTRLSLPFLDFKEGNDVVRIHIDHDLRDIFHKLRDVDKSAAELIHDWFSQRRNATAESRSPSKNLNLRWTHSYLDIEMIGLLKYAKIEVVGHQSFHLDLLQTITDAGSPFCGLFLTPFNIFRSTDRRVFGYHESGCRVSVHDLLDSVRKFRNWYCYRKAEGAAQPTMNNIGIAFPAGGSIQPWFYFIIRTLLEALELCLEKETSNEDFTRRLALG